MLTATPRSIFPALLVATVMAFAVTTASAQQWTTNFTQALKASQKTGKPLLVNFTGSDWCGWCIRLKAEVFDKPEFKRWAAENVILVELDYPQRKQLPAALKAQNEKLREHYQIRGYPTILILNGEGEVIGRTGYNEGGPKVWIESVQPIVDAAKPQPAETTTDLAAAREDAAQSGKALMVILETRPTEANARRLDALLKDSKFKELAQLHLNIVHLQKAGEQTAPADQIAAAESLLDTLKAAPGPLRTAIIDPTQDEPKLLLSAAEILPASTIVSRLKDKLPTRQYRGAWISDFEEGKALAAQLDRPLLVNFTGSSWCPPCIAMNRSVFSSDAFKAYAKENLVLVKLDFPSPRSKDPLTPEQMANMKLVQQYKVRGLPTMVIFDAKNKEIGRTGFTPDGPDAYIASLKKIIDPAQ